MLIPEPMRLCSCGRQAVRDANAYYAYSEDVVNAQNRDCRSPTGIGLDGTQVGPCSYPLVYPRTGGRHIEYYEDLFGRHFQVEDPRGPRERHRR